jgi:oxaloacetate decarboxylase alpha subunit
VKQVRFVDQTFRDATQSLCGHLVSTEMIRTVLPLVDRVGYECIEITGLRGLLVAKRRFGEKNVFERFRTFAEVVKTPLRAAVAQWGLSGFNIEPLAASELFIERAVANGISGFWICDYQTQTGAISIGVVSRLVKLIKSKGAKAVVGLMYTCSPVHSDEIFAQKTKIIAEMNADVIRIEDASGILTPERVKTLLPAVQRESRGIPIELHAHCNVGLAPLCYLEAMKLGIGTFHTAVSPLANDTSLPSVENILRNAQRLGYSADLDMDAIDAIARHFRKILPEHGLRIGQPLEFDIFQFEHQVPGGMSGTLMNQLSEIKNEDRLGEVLEEIVRIRQEFGYPVMATPYSQIIGAQAVFNVISGERYKVVPVETVKFMLGWYGEMYGAIDQNVKEKILSSPIAKKFLNWKPPEVTIEDLRRKVAPGLSDDELISELVDPRGEIKGRLRDLYQEPA